ncbi:MAG TPA: helix-turn-helix transcriptional regulator [Nocardioidaceae bacterium]|nr:helix-turn-helix transcriptional regulator [Nocardioidaceae bacterium]
MKQRVRWAYDTRELGDAVRRVRVEQDLTQAELAERLGVVRMTISRLEQGEAVSMDTALRALAECGYAVAIAPKFSRLVIEDDEADPRPKPATQNRHFGG